MRSECRRLFATGATLREIAARHGVPMGTLKTWHWKDKWAGIREGGRGRANPQTYTVRFERAKALYPRHATRKVAQVTDTPYWTVIAWAKRYGWKKEKTVDGAVKLTGII